MENEQYRNKYQDERIKTVEGHIEKINEELGDIKVDVAKIKTNVCWLVKWFWVVIAASIATILTTLAGFLLKK